MKEKSLKIKGSKGFFIASLDYSDQTYTVVFGLGQSDKKKRRQLFADGVLNKNPASSYSPTQLPVQYHRR